MSDLMLVGIIFLGMAALAVLGYGIAAAIIYISASATGRVLTSEVVVRGRGSSASNYPRVTYAYSVLGRQYQSDRIFIGGPVGGWQARPIVDRYAVGSTTQVFYNPDRPEEAVLERRAPKASYFVLMAVLLGSIFGCAGAALVIFNLK